MQIRTFSQQGIYTQDNRDVVTYRHSACETATLFILLDGATSSPSSGDFSRELAELIIADFHKLPTHELFDENGLLRILNAAQTVLQHKYVCDSSSLLLVLKNGVQLLVVHAGDCCLGSIHTTHNIQWLTRVHTFANAINDTSIDKIKHDPRRHTLTKCFKAKKYVMPDIQYLTLPNTPIIMATDGFWALANSTQSALITQTATQFKPEDDASFIILESEQSETSTLI